LKLIKRVRAPVRIDFAGGTTDISPFRDEYGGAVLNAAINKYVYGELVSDDKSTKLEYHADVPTSSGLGTSSSMNDVWVALITHLKDKRIISEDVFNIEHAITESAVNGKQDMYAAAYGGINYMEFIGDKVIVHPLKLKEKTLKELEGSLVLVYSGISHLSGTSNKAAIDNLLKGKNTDQLIRLKEIAGEMKNALIKGDLYMFANLMNKETIERRKLSKITISPKLQEIIDLGMKNGALGAKYAEAAAAEAFYFLLRTERNL